MQRETWLPAAPESATVARALVREAGRRAQLDGARLFELALATTEAIANAIDHGQACGERGEILLRIEPRKGGLRVEVCDCGRFSPPQVRDEHSNRGRGLPIIRAMTDHLEILPGRDRTRVRFEKR